MRSGFRIATASVSISAGMTICRVPSLTSATAASSSGFALRSRAGPPSRELADKLALSAASVVDRSRIGPCAPAPQRDSRIRGGFVVRAIPSDRPVMTPRRSAGLDARAPTGSTPAGDDVGSANTSRARLKPPPTHQPDEGIDSVLGDGLRDSPPRAEDRRLTRPPSAAHRCGKRRPANPRSPADRPGCEKRTPRRLPAVTTMPPTPPMQPWQRDRRRQRWLGSPSSPLRSPCWRCPERKSDRQRRAAGVIARVKDDMSKSGRSRSTGATDHPSRHRPPTLAAAGPDKQRRPRSKTPNPHPARFRRIIHDRRATHTTSTTSTRRQHTALTPASRLR